MIYKRPYSLLSLFLTLTLLGACAYETEFPADSADECFEDEIYDAEAGVCYLACEDDDTCEEIDFFGFLGGIFDEVSGLVFYSGEGDPLVMYEVDGDEIGFAEFYDAETDEDEEIQDDTAVHEEVWETFVTLIPADNRELISEYGVFTDGVDEVMAYVEPDPEDPTQWRLVVDVLDLENQGEFIYTLIHEYGHILTLNDDQVPFDEDVYFSDDDIIFEEAMAACSTFFTGEGCSHEDSYINAFYQQFWADIYDENQEIDPEDYDGLYAFYEDYADRFLTDYAATNPGEDIAEAWTAFVLNPKPTGSSIADQKVLFFYDYPELVALRDEIVPKVYALSR